MKKTASLCLALTATSLLGACAYNDYPDRYDRYDRYGRYGHGTTVVVDDDRYYGRYGYDRYDYDYYDRDSYYDRRYDRYKFCPPGHHKKGWC